MKTMNRIARAAVLAVLVLAVVGCDNGKPPPQTGGGGSGGNPGSAGSPGSSISLGTWMEGIAKNGDVDVTAMPANVLFTVTDKQPVSAGEASAVTPQAGKVTVVYDEDPTALRFLFESDPRFQAP
jgi:hypothetical protein